MNSAQLAKGREHLRRADPVLARLIAANPDLDPRAWLTELPPMHPFGVLLLPLRDLAERFCDGRLSAEALDGMSDAEVEAVLTEVPGIGPWTVHDFLIIALDRPDVLLPGDIALRRAVMRAYGFDHLPDQQEMERLAGPWRPYRSLAVAYLFSALFAAPREGAAADAG